MTKLEVRLEQTVVANEKGFFIKNLDLLSEKWLLICDSTIKEVKKFSRCDNSEIDSSLNSGFFFQIQNCELKTAIGIFHIYDEMHIEKITFEEAIRRIYFFVGDKIFGDDFMPKLIWKNRLFHHTLCVLFNGNCILNYSEKRNPLLAAFELLTQNRYQENSRWPIKEIVSTLKVARPNWF